MKLIAVTSCPVGMAHTYMAASSLKKTAKRLGYEIKVETQGALGIQNRLSSVDIEEADVFILAADVALQEAERFDQCATYKVSTSQLIKKCEKSITEAIASLQA
ncbi:MAG: PTS fructose transporter subunit IIB [Vallitaleaceae bacterium]|jgi:PTS system fructose-specific IIB component|nr:PTS fructose transporter subunit IIB [Vallitaleaceae bacterium]